MSPGWLRFKRAFRKMTRKLSNCPLVLATHNPGKIREITALLAPYGIETKSAADFDLEGPDETENTFEGNARLKARYSAKATGLPALADDSGIEVDGLDGAPGVYTADWAETPDGRDYLVAMARVWRELDDRNVSEPRTARFVSTFCVYWPDGLEAFYRGSVEGRLIWPIRGDNGFGFDPMFVPNGQSQTFGEMPPEKKQYLSHRTAAFAAFKAGCLD